MSKLYLYSVFHGNLNFSYIPHDLYPQILERCYWPLLQVIEERQFPLGLEFSGHTLEVLNALDHSFVDRLRQLWQDGVCEFIGSGYTQAIMPLIPAKANRKNLDLGNAVYQKLLGQRPKTALLNEQVYSAGLPRLYQEAGYETLIVNWDSAVPAHAEKELMYRPCMVPLGQYGGESDGKAGNMPVVWHSLLAYRNFQRYVEGEISQDAFLNRLSSHMPAEGERAYPLYCSDWEVFDFKPWRVYPEGFKQPRSDEMVKIADLLDLLTCREDIELVTPANLVKLFPPSDLVHPESVEHPLPYKKQEIHSVGRWAVGGRSGVQNNTQCYRLYQQLSQADWRLEQSQAEEGSKAAVAALWQELCFLWNSDFRTFTTEEKHQEFQRRMGSASVRADQLLESLASTNLEHDRFWLANSTLVPALAEPASFTIYTNGKGTPAPASYELELEGQAVACQVTHETALSQGLNKLTLETIPMLAPNQSAIGVVKAGSPVPSGPRQAWHVDRENHEIVTPSVTLALLPNWGGTIDSLAFPEISSQALIRRGQESSPQPVWATDNLFAGDLVLRDWQGRTVTDHQSTGMEYPEPGQSHEIFVPVRCCVQTALGTIWKTYRVYLHQPRVDLMIRFQWRDAVPRSFRLGTMPLNPGAWDKASLYYATTNGGEEVERFPLAGRCVGHGTPLPGDVTSRGCLGATEAWTVLGDAEKGIGFVTRPGELYSVPMVHYEETPDEPDSFLLSLTHSLGEWDETSHTLWRGHSTWFLSVLGGMDDIIATTQACASLSNGGLVVRSGPDLNSYS